MNWKLRLQNKVTLTALIAGVAALVYQVLGWFGIIPRVPMTELLDVCSIIIELLVLAGVVVDPTTAGWKDSARAMTYNQPKEVTEPDEAFPVGGENAGDDEQEHEADDPADPEV